jgi:serine/threonine protein kinase
MPSTDDGDDGDDGFDALLRAVAESPSIPLTERDGGLIHNVGNHMSRFRLLRRLGAGAMGVVYEALDQQCNLRVAVKTLRYVDAHRLYRLKREFRSLRDLGHRNLIALHELFEEHGHWFFTMELLDGDDLDRYFSRLSSGDATAEGAPTAAAAQDQGLRPPPAVDFGRVREVLAQVTEGLIAIHDAGKIHRDIKPSNIIVTRDGRAVILDFGLVIEQTAAARSSTGEVVGTAMYMAPEQAAGDPVGPAADWYSLGVTLYEIITGQRLFGDAWRVVLFAKQHTEPHNPKVVNPSCPDDLAELCVRLLQIDPRRRPQGPEVLSWLAAGKHERLALADRDPTASSRRSAFVGRERELRELRRAFDEVRRGTAITVFVHGESGIGKTTLIHHFIGAIEDEVEDAVILAGQCREHEAIPFKAMDGVIDALARHVSRLSAVAAAELVPKNAALLPSVFPVLGRISSVAKAPPPVPVISDPFQRRKRVFAALREMLGLLTERNRVVCVIDDMQWVDSDSLHLLTELLQPPDQPELLLLASVRTDGGAASLPELPGEVRCVHVQPLDPQESMTLVGMLLDRIAPERKTQTTRIVDDTNGHPLFIGELVRYAAGVNRPGARQLHLDEAIWARASQLDPASLSVLQILSTAVAPLAEDIVRAAANLDASAFQRAVRLLRAGHLLRSASSTHAVLDIYHDRVRQAVLLHIDTPERIAVNERIAKALETFGVDVQPEMLVRHLQAAMQFERAARMALEAAERALAGLALEQAIQLYKAALGLTSWSEGEHRDILIRLGGALAAVGRGPDAASAYAQAARKADPATQLSCRIQEAEQLVQSGHLDRGAILLFSLFREHGHDVPDSPRQIMLRIVWYRMRLALRGLRWTDRPRTEVQPRDLALLTLYKAAARGLILVDPVRAAYFVIRGLNLSMRIGDREFILYFLMLETAIRSGLRNHRHASFIGGAEVIMQNVSDPLFQTIYAHHLGTLAYLTFDRDFKKSVALLDRGDETLTQMVNVAWESAAGRFFLLSGLDKMGDFAKLRTYSERFRREAEQRGNIYSRTTIGRLCNVLWLVDDDPDGARADLKTNSWAVTLGYHLQHWLELNALVNIAIYEGSSIDRTVFFEQLAAANRSALRWLPRYRCETAWMVGRMALSDGLRGRLQRRVVGTSIAKLFSYDTHYTRMLAYMLRATLALQDGERETAVRDFREVIAVGEATDILFVTSVARRLLGVLVHGDEGRELVTTAEQWMRGAGIKNLDRMTNLVSPCKLDGGG